MSPIIILNIVLAGLAILVLLVGGGILTDEVLREGHRETNAVLMGLLMCGWGLSTVHRVFNDLFLFATNHVRRGVSGAASLEPVVSSRRGRDAGGGLASGRVDLGRNDRRGFGGVGVISCSGFCPEFIRAPKGRVGKTMS